MKKYFPQQKGFVILFTILISTIILMIGLGIFSIATRETVLSGTAREAQYAFYAADTGVECALYAQSLGVLSLNGGAFECGAIPVNVTGTGIQGDPFVFNVLVDSIQKTCARVTVFDSTTASGAPARRIISQGYNVCDGTTAKPLTKNPLLVERDLDTLFETGMAADPLSSLDPIPGGTFNQIDPSILNGATLLGGQ